MLEGIVRRAMSTVTAGPSSVPQPAEIQFLCDPADFGVIAEPIPARMAMPDWFRRLPAVDKDVVSASNNGLTVKRCMPFLDAMTLGYILPLAATTRLVVRDGGETVDAGWEFDRVMVSNHGSYQIAGSPHGKRPPMKLHNYWTVKTPPGWSCLFIAPLNRPALPLEIIAGVVDTDRYASLINFPFVATGADGVYTIEKGTPLVQVIPFRRDEGQVRANVSRQQDERLNLTVRPERPEESDTREKIRRNTTSIEGWYRRFMREKR